MIPRPDPIERGTAISVDGTHIAWSRYGRGDRTVLVVPTWNLVDSRVVGHQVVALAPHATVVTYDPRGAGASDRPATGYGFDLHAADALAVLDATGTARAAILAASRGLNAVVLIATEHAERIERIAVVAPYMQLEPEPPPDSEALERLRTDWRGFIDPFMHAVFSEPGSDEVIAEMIDIGMDSTPDVVATQELELDWATPARLLGEVEHPALVIHGAEDGPVPVELAEDIATTMPNGRLVVIPGGGHRPDIRSPEHVNPILLEFLVGVA